MLTVFGQNFIWVPAAIYFGRRPVWLLTCTIAFCFAIWAAVAKDLNSLLAARVVVSIAGSNTEALGAILVNVRLCDSIIDWSSG